MSLGWIHNLADSSTLADFLSESGHDTIRDYVGGFTGSCEITLGAVALIGEYVTALDDFAVNEVDFAGQGAAPSAWNVELSYTTELGGRETMFAVGYQGTDEALALGLPRARFLWAAGVNIFAETTLILEYYHDQDYDFTDGGTDASADTLTARLACEF